MSIKGFSAEPYDSGVILKWDPGAGSATSTTNSICEVSVQYSENGVANVIPNTPPYVVRDFRQTQLTKATYWHPNLINDNQYIYSLFVHYLDTGAWTGPQVFGPITPSAELSPPFESGSLSFSKLGVNTILTSSKENVVDIVIWLPESQVSRKPLIETIIDEFKPAHTVANILYEPFYIAQTTTEQFQSGSYASGSFNVENGTITNKVPTIDHSFSGTRTILGGS